MSKTTPQKPYTPPSNCYQGTDHRIQAGAVATSGQHANAHGKTLL